ncbi:MAG: 50S ribosomal protein L23 [Proteobacteria bacterium]|jgi:large subunit ribosomal protein L23|nr:50S ribosomal protein L23 [Candidatus Fonsibacter sp. PEL5]NKA16500.1 50S ribosomal protein L23 [Candidatus Fonsibacter sp. PEL55]
MKKRADNFSYDIILEPVVTEKSTNLSSLNKVVFKVAPFATKANIKKSVEKLFKVNVTKVNTINLHPRFKLVRGRVAKSSGYKKAIVTLKKGQSIDITTGI